MTRPSCSSWRSRWLRMFGAISGIACCTSPNRPAPSSSAATTSSFPRSPTVASASARPERGVAAFVWLERRSGRGCGVVTAANQVVTLASNLRSREPVVAFADGRRETATVAGVDPDLGVAVLTLDTGDVAPLQWASDDVAPALGSAVIAVANPGGQALRATPGFVPTAGPTFRGPPARPPQR